MYHLPDVYAAFLIMRVVYARVIQHTISGSLQFELTSVIYCRNVEGGHCHRDVNKLLSANVFDSVFRIGGDIDEITRLYVSNIWADLYSALPTNNDVSLFRHMVVRLLPGARLDRDPGDCQIVGRSVTCLKQYVRYQTGADSF